MNWRLVNILAGWRERIANTTHIHHLLKLVWQTDPKLFVATFTLRLLRAIIPLALLWVPKLILDSVIAIRSRGINGTGHVWRLLALECALALLSDAVARIGTFSESVLSDKFAKDTSIRLIKHACALDLHWFEDPKFYDKLERARNQTNGRLILFASLLGLLQELLTFTTLVTSLVVLSHWMIPILLLTIAPALLCDTHFSAASYSAIFRWTPWRRELDYIRYLGTSSYSAKEVKLFGLAAYLSDLYEKTSSRITLENHTLIRKRVSYGMFWNLVYTLGYYGAYASVVAAAVLGAMTLGTLTFVAGSFARSRVSLQRVSDYVSDITENLLLLSDLFDFFKMQPSIRSGLNARRISRPIFRGFEFRDVSFTYPGTQKYALRNVTFRLAPGQTIALIGRNGSGKTTIVKLLSRLYDPTEGRIMLDGVDLREYDVEDLRRHIGVIFQDFARYDMLVRENIAIGDIKAIDDFVQVEAAAKHAQADDFIKRLSNGYNQMIGQRFEGGIDLSGGEWQKIALARAYMRTAQILVLDEPTASLDARAEFEVFRRFAELTAGRMSILISHRFATARIANSILVLEAGEIRERGSHRELLSLNGQYAELFEMQAAGYR